ncbi:MAG: right-handed parallel beta-helix repeat-containing protein, partial [Armatimonadota bacterium]
LVPTAGLVLRSLLSVVEDLQIANMGGDGLRLTSVSANGTRITNSQVNGRISDNFITNSGRHGVFVEDPGNSVTDWTLSDNWIANSGVDGVHLDNAAGWVVERNHIYGVPHNAIYAHRIFATSICDNYLETFGETTEAGTWCGIVATVQGAAASTIAHNRIFNFGLEKQVDSVYRYLALSVNYGQGVVIVSGNAIRGAGTPRGTGLYYTAGEKQGLTVVSTGNAVEGVGTPRFSEGHVVVTAGQ